MGYNVQKKLVHDLLPGDRIVCADMIVRTVSSAQNIPHSSTFRIDFIGDYNAEIREGQTWIQVSTLTETLPESPEPDTTETP